MNNYSNTRNKTQSVLVGNFGSEKIFNGTTNSFYTDKKPTPTMQKGNKSFAPTIQKLKNKPQQKVLQDEYINGLQQQIKYLEYQLKLLKDKEIMQREGVNQLDNFLKDDIPINQNILAIKNKYNATKKTLEDKLHTLMDQNKTAGQVLQKKTQQIEQFHQLIDDYREKGSHTSNDLKQKLVNNVNQATLAENQTARVSEHTKQLQRKIKVMGQEISTIQRNLQKQKVQQVRQVEQKQKKQRNIAQKSQQTLKNLLLSLQELQYYNFYQQKRGSNPHADQMQEANSFLRKKLMLCQKKKSTAQNTISQFQLILKQLQRERQNQRRQRNRIQKIIQQNKRQIDSYEQNHQAMTQKQFIKQKNHLLNKYNYQLKEKEENCQFQTQKLQALQHRCSEFISDKKDLQETLEAEEKFERQLLEKKKELEHEIARQQGQIVALNEVTKEVLEETVPIKNELQKCQGRIPLIQKQIEKKNISIHHLNKQVDLLKDLRALDLDQLQMISTSGVQMQNALHEFIKNWEKLKSI